MQLNFKQYAILSLMAIAILSELATNGNLIKIAFGIFAFFGGIISSKLEF